MTWKKKGNRIRASDKSLVYHFCIGWLLLLFVAVFLLLNLRQLLVIDWKDFNLLHAGITWTAYNSITVLIATGVCALVAFLYYRYGYDRIKRLLHRQKLARMVLENKWYEVENTKDSGFFTDLQSRSREKIVWFPKIYYQMDNGLLHILCEITMGKYQEQLLSLEDKLESGLYCELTDKTLHDGYIEYTLLYDMIASRISIDEVVAENGGLRFVVAPTTTIVDRETGSVITADKLTEGMEVAVIYSANAPMGMSMPPYMGQVTAVVANADKGSISVGHFNDDLLNEKDLLQLNISEDTTILTTLGTKSILSADDVKGKDAVVFYDITTRSIPAQTNPSLVLLLEEREAATEDTEEAAVDTKSVEAPEMVALRDAAEAKGYSVKWQGKTAPVVLEKDGMTAQITLGSTTYVVEGDMAMTSAAAAELTDGVLYVSADVVENLK